MPRPTRPGVADPQADRIPPRAPAEVRGEPGPAPAVPVRVAAGMPLSPAHVMRLQRTVGNRAVGALLARGAARGMVQRDPEWKDDNHPDDYMDAFVAALDTVVQTAAASALDPDGLPDGDGYLRLWKDTAIILRAIADDEIDRDDSDEVAEANAAKRFGPARYGYAVESLACGESGTLNAALPQGCSYQLQASRGMTRPDIVVRHVRNGEIAWLDITSAGSIGHIDRKTGSGWKNKTYVAEITYPALDPSAVGASKLGIGERVARRNAIKRRIKAWDDLVNATRKQFRTGWENRDGDDLTSKAEKATLARTLAGEIIGVASASPQATKSLIRVFQLEVRNYGLDAGGSKSEGEEILRGVYGV